MFQPTPEDRALSPGLCGRTLKNASEQAQTGFSRTNLHFHSFVIVQFPDAAELRSFPSLILSLKSLVTSAQIALEFSSRWTPFLIVSLLNLCIADTNPSLSF